MFTVGWSDARHQRARKESFPLVVQRPSLPQAARPGDYALVYLGKSFRRCHTNTLPVTLMGNDA